MKRKYRKTQDQADLAIATAIQSGITSKPELRQILRDLVQDLSWREVAEYFARSELAQSKQRLRKDGLIEMTKGNEPKPVEQLDAADVEFIDGRRNSKIVGQIKSRVVFNHRHGRHEAAAEAGRMLQVVCPDEQVETPENADALSAPPQREPQA